MLSQIPGFNFMFYSIFLFYYFFVLNSKEDWSGFIDSIIEKNYRFMLENMNLKVDISKRALISVCISLLYMILKRNQFDLIEVIKSVLLAMIIWKIQYYYVYQKYQKNLKEAQIMFPSYLNNLAILIQQNPVPIALAKSIDNAPSIFVSELKCLVNEIHEGKKKGLVPYLEFANKFKQVEDLNRIMKTLYNVSATTIDKDKIITSTTKMANEKISIARKINFDNKLDQQALFTWIGFIWIGFVIISMFLAININGIGF